MFGAGSPDNAGDIYSGARIYTYIRDTYCSKSRVGTVGSSRVLAMIYRTCAIADTLLYRTPENLKFSPIIIPDTTIYYVMHYGTSGPEYIPIYKKVIPCLTYVQEPPPSPYRIASLANKLKKKKKKKNRYMLRYYAFFHLQQLPSLHEIGL